jgi:hypothetical protein
MRGPPTRWTYEPAAGAQRLTATSATQTLNCSLLTLSTHQYKHLEIFKHTTPAPLIACHRQKNENCPWLLLKTLQTLRLSGISYHIHLWHLHTYNH